MKQIGHKMPLRTIVVHGTSFYVSAYEGNCDESFYLRCYSEHKTSYVETIFNWYFPDSPKLNPYRPAFAAAVIQYAIEKGWNYKEKNQIVVLSAEQRDRMIEKLNLQQYL